MNIKKSISVFFAIFFLMTKIGVAFNIHYCHGQIAEVKHIFQHKEGCGMDMSMDMNSSTKKQLNKKSCCSDEVITIQNTDINTITDKLELSKPLLIAVLNTAILFHLIEFPPQNNIMEVEYENSSHSPPLYQLYCNYTLYS